mmetsp:Transcript_13462/g.19844  ORF Transcript_13462/g.19844 Transcript_13462/m.19844 type:complete len:193 (+) Transcript_13462:47-625(+)
MKLAAIFLLLAGLLPGNVLAADEIKNLRGIPDARKLIADAVLSSVHNSAKEGEVEQEVLDRAVNAGLPEKLVRKLGQEAYDKVAAGQATVDMIETEMMLLRAQDDVDAPKPERMMKSLDHARNEGRRLENIQPGEITAEGIRKLYRAVQSGYQSAGGLVDAQLMQEAVNAGVSHERVMKSLDMMKKGFGFEA